MHVCLCLSTAQKAAHFGNFTRTTSILNVEFLSLGSLQLPAVKTAQVFLHLCTIDTDEWNRRKRAVRHFFAPTRVFWERQSFRTRRWIRFDARLTESTARISSKTNLLPSDWMCRHRATSAEMTLIHWLFTCTENPLLSSIFRTKLDEWIVSFQHNGGWLEVDAQANSVIKIVGVRKAEPTLELLINCTARSTFHVQCHE